MNILVVVDSLLLCNYKDVDWIRVTRVEANA
jgi:hypothetical protein